MPCVLSALVRTLWSWNSLARLKQQCRRSTPLLHVLVLKRDSWWSLSKLCCNRGCPSHWECSVISIFLLTKNCQVHKIIQRNQLRLHSSHRGLKWKVNRCKQSFLSSICLSTAISEGFNHIYLPAERLSPQKTALIKSNENTCLFLLKYIKNGSRFS